MSRDCVKQRNDSSGNCKLRFNYVHEIIEAFILFDNPYVPRFPFRNFRERYPVRLLCSLALN